MACSCFKKYTTKKYSSVRVVANGDIKDQENHVLVFEQEEQKCSFSCFFDLFHSLFCVVI